MASMPPLLSRLATSNLSLLRFQQLQALHRPFRQQSPFELRRRIPAYLIPLTATAFSNLLSLFSLLWDSILLAAPKQKTSYSKKRSRQLAGKALKDVTNLNHCSACGRVKRAHILCPYCVALIKDMWRSGGLNSQSSEMKLQDPSATASATKTIANPLKFPEPPKKK